jgi:hypothetical protein
MVNLYYALRSVSQVAEGLPTRVVRGVLSSLCLCAALSISCAQAQDGRSLLEEAQRRALSQSLRYEGTLRLVDSSGRITEKRWHYSRLGSHGSSKTLLRFSAPAEVKGVALLILNHLDRASDQWMWTPALQRTRRITLNDRSARFLGTDFTFEDLEERNIDQFVYRLLGEETVDGAPCWKIEAEPTKSKASQYTSSSLFVRKDNYVLVQVDGYVKDELIKQVKSRQIELISNIWTARAHEMRDFRRQSHTVLRLERVEYNVPMSDEDFRLPALRREP